MIDEEKTFYNPGDRVVVRHFKDAPEMYVVEKVTRTIHNKEGHDEQIFVGIKTRWFDKNGKLNEAIFSTKDLKHV